MIQVKPLPITPETDLEWPEIVHREAPQYPDAAAENGQFGYAIVRYVIHPDGSVPIADVVAEYPKAVFGRNAILAMKKYRFTPSSKAHVGLMNMAFNLNGRIDYPELQQSLEKNKSWVGALLGSVRHQQQMADALKLIEIYENNLGDLSTELDLPSQLPELAQLSVSKRPSFRGKLGEINREVVIELDNTGTIVKEHYVTLDNRARRESLIGLKIQEQAKPGIYLIRKIEGRPSWVEGFLLPNRPNYLVSNYWNYEAAANGI